jgi:hypothetical protein
MLQCNALPNQCSAGTVIGPGSFNDVVEEPNYFAVSIRDVNSFDRADTNAQSRYLNGFIAVE